MTGSLRGFAALSFAAALLAVALLAAALLAPLASRRARAERRAFALQQRRENDQHEAAAAAEAAPAVEASLKRLEASVPSQRADVELVDQLREAARLAGATRVSIAPEGGVLVASTSTGQKARPTAVREPGELQTERVTLTAEGRYAAFVALLGELSRLPRLETVENVSLVRQPPGLAMTLTLRAAHW